MNRAPDRLFTSAFIALSLSELAYFTAGGLMIGLTPFLVTGPIGGDEAGVGLAGGAFAVTTLALPGASPTGAAGGRCSSAAARSSRSCCSAT